MCGCVFHLLTFFICFLECQILNVSFLAESSGDQRGNKTGLKQVAGKAHTGWHSHGKLFLFLLQELCTSPHTDLMNTGGSTYFCGPGKQMWFRSARFTTRIIS